MKVECIYSGGVISESRCTIELGRCLLVSLLGRSLSEDLQNTQSNLRQSANGKHSFFLSSRTWIACVYDYVHRWALRVWQEACF